MHLTKVSISNIRSIKSLDWSPPANRLAGWHVVLGDNGAGKSSFLRSIALALLGPTEAAAARQDWNAWLRKGTEDATIEVEILRDAILDRVSTKGNHKFGTDVTAQVNIKRVKGITTLETSDTKAKRHVWGAGAGWFSAAYGPFRRFSGGDREADRIFFSNPRLGAHVSVFGEDAALTESVRWLMELQFQKYENGELGGFIDRLTDFINQDNFLPHGIKLSGISSKGVEFLEPGGDTVSVEELSDGYRSILSMTFELMRQLSRTYGPAHLFSEDNTFVKPPGIVLIDEIDAHLHPSWQKVIGFWLIRHFPNIQFIVTTHSPLVCQAAVEGSIYRLPNPGSDELGFMLKGVERNRLVYGDILEAYSTELFGSAQTRSDLSSVKEDRLAALNSKELFASLNPTERRERETLRAIFPTESQFGGS